MGDYSFILTNSAKYQNKKNSAKKIIINLSFCILIIFLN
ncbi:hypothetical protein ACINWC141_1743 [Acinetobacter sp. WC-141]|nr:hypothetical protein ACINWC141_1743 [Acinetobacter sp. WC-141]